MTRLIPLLLSALLLAGCAVSTAPAPHSKSENCGAWDDMRRGLVSCEVGDECAYEAADRHFVCGCADASHVFYCEHTP